MRIIGLCLFLFPLTGLAQAPGGSEICAGCHGARGEGNPQNGYPRIAGQPREYLQRQIAKQLKPGKGLTDADIKALAAYFASQPPPQPTTVAQKPAAAKSSSGGTRAGAGTQPRQGGGVTGSEPRPAGIQGPGGAGTQ